MMIKKKIKVAFIFGALGGGGAQRQFGHLLNHINRDHFQPIVISIGRSMEETLEFVNKYSEEQISENAELSKTDFENYYLFRKLKHKEEIYFISKFTNSKLKIQKLLFKLFKKLKPDISLAMSPYSMGMSVFPLLLNKIKYRIHSVRSNEMLLEHKKTFANYFYWLVDYWTTMYTVNSEELKRKVAKNSLFNKQIANIHNGIPVFYELPKEQTNNQIIKIAYVARLYEVKNHKMLIDTIPLISTKKDFLVLIYGTGPLERELKEYVEEKELSNKVIFMGWQKDISNHLPDIDITVLTSRGEGFNNSIAEAQMHGIPVVSTKCTGSAEIVLDKETGYLVNTDDIEGFAQMLNKLIENDELRNNFGRKAYERSRKLYTVDAMVKKYEALFLSIVKDK